MLLHSLLVAGCRKTASKPSQMDLDQGAQKGSFARVLISPPFPETGRGREVEIMPDGDVEKITAGISRLGVGGSEVGTGSEKDPTKIARKYQLDLCKKALEENVIVYLETGSGKTHIAVLLIYELRHLIRKPQQNICVFLAPTVALVQQQARVIEESLDVKVGCYSGGSKHLKTHEEWEKEIEKYEVFVMTPMILLQNLSHRFMKMEFIALLIFDECHHAQMRSGHPYAEIMKVFYQDDVPKLPRIFGMTASPVVGKGASDLDNLPRSINSLERLLDAKVYTVEDREELDKYVAPPIVKVYFYGSSQPGASISYGSYFDQLEEIKRQCLSMLSTKTDDLENIQNSKKMLRRIHDSILVCAEKLGLWGAMQACQIFLGVDNSERLSLIEAEGNSSDMAVCDIYLNKAFHASTFNEDDRLSNLSSKEVLMEPFFSSKLSCLVGILSSFRSRPDMKCIVFVNRIIVARALTYILKNIAVLDYWKCDYLVGINSVQRSMSRKNMKIILEKFQSGKLNLLVATKVGEEGLDIQSCCLVIRFDPPETVASFIQSRGRARMRHSEYAFLVDRHNKNELDLIENFKKDEARMNVEIASRTSEATLGTDEESIYKVESSGASVSSAYSLSLLYQYCAKLPHDEYFDPLPRFYYFDDTEGTICHIILPSNAPIHQIISTTQTSIEAAKKDASLQAIKELHKVGALDDYLLPLREHANQEEMVPHHDFDNVDDEALRRELHEMLVPSVLKEAWSHSDDVIHLNYYFMSFHPEPMDRTYKEFGLFVKTPLPAAAEALELELHLARGRTVTTKLIHLGVVAFNRNEIFEAQNFQEMFLKVILDRAEFVQCFVALGENTNFPAGVSLFYLLLPVLCKDKNNLVDWKTIRRCLSSPMFGNPADGLIRVDIYSESTVVLENGTLNKSDVENSLVYVPHKKEFFFVTSINWEKNGHSLYKEADCLSHVGHLSRTFGIHLKYAEQPLLHAKPLFSLHNLLHKRKQEDSDARELEEYFIDLPPELCQLKILGFSKDIGSSLSLLPSIIHRLESLLAAVQLKQEFSMYFPEGKEVTAETLLKALTTEKCQERFSLERLEVLGDAFLKFSAGRHLFLLHHTLDEGGLTGKRSNMVNNSNLFKLAVEKNLQVYIRDQPFEPSQFFAVGRPCQNNCNYETEGTIHSRKSSKANNGTKISEVRCNRNHHWLPRKTVADVLEALVGAFLVDSGFKAATAFLKWIGIDADFDNSQLSKAFAASVQYMPLTEIMDVHSIQHHLGYKFRHEGLLLQAFIHPSYNKHGGGCYQRLEFLGDAVLDYLITSYLFTAYPKLKPGQLTDLRSLSVNNKAFAGVAVARSFHKFLLHNSPSLSKAIEEFAAFLKKPATERGSHEGPKCPKALGDVVESCVGAVFLDTGFDLNKVWSMMVSFLDPIAGLSSLQLSPIRDLQELCQSRNWDLELPATKDGNSYTVEARVMGKNISVTASCTNRNKKDAIRISSQGILAKLKAAGHLPKTTTLEEALKSAPKMEPKLIGYDEALVEVSSSDPTQFDYIKVENVKYPADSRTSVNKSSPRIVSLSDQLLRQSKSARQCLTGRIDGSSSCSDSMTEGEAPKSAKSRLHEICAANCWNPPLFECCKTEGPGHLMLFTYKVIVKVEESPNRVLEFFSEPRPTKKAAAEHAAEGAIWYLKHQGYAK